MANDGTYEASHLRVGVKRSTTLRDRHRAAIRRTQPPCGICGDMIDYTLPYLHPRSFVVDHITPLARGGQDVLSNKQATHRECNANKAARLNATKIKRSRSLQPPQGDTPHPPLRRPFQA